jgi:Tfp pilus assembly PilM family ATPase
MQVITDEISKTMEFFKSHFANKTPAKIYITGDGAILIGLPEYLQEKLGLPVERFDPLKVLDADKEIKSQIESISGTGYSVAIGLALKAE